MALRFNQKGSFMKEFFYLKTFAKKEITLQTEFGDFTFTPPLKIITSSTIFNRTYNCLDFFPCRECCKGIWELFPLGFIQQESIDAVLTRKYKDITVKINNNDYNYLCLASDGDYCSLSDSSTGCTVHKSQPITCHFPLVHFRNNRGRTMIVTSSFGRNWALGCPVNVPDFKEFLSVEQFEERVLSRFVRLRDYSNFLKIDNTLDEYILNLERQFKNIHNRKKKQLFF